MKSIKIATTFAGISTIAFVFILIITFVMKYNVQGLENELVSLNKEISQTKNSIHILKAEWTLFNSPQRLRNLAEKHIKLKNLEAEQIINYSMLPLSDDDKRIASSSKNKYKKLTSQER